MRSLFQNPFFSAGMGMLGNRQNPWMGAMQGMNMAQMAQYRQHQMAQQQKQQAMQSQVMQMRMAQMQRQAEEAKRLQQNRGLFRGRLESGGELDPRAMMGMAADAGYTGLASGFLKQAFPEPKELWEVVQDPYGRGGVGQRSSTTGKLSGYQGPETGAAGPFEGTGMEAQALNIIAAGDQKKARGEPLTPQETHIYNLAKRHLESSRVVGTPQAGYTEVRPPPLPGYPASTPPVATPPAGAPPAGAPAVGAPPAAPPRVSQITPPKPPKMTAAQGTTAIYADRMAEAEVILAKVDLEGASFWGRLAEQTPGGNYLQSPEHQMYEQAKRNFTTAVLRKESGAVISDQEFVSAEKQYFPMPGDSAKVIEQKRQNRQTALEGMRRAAGPAYKAPKSAPTSFADLADDKLHAVDAGQLSDELLEEYVKELRRRGR